MPKTKTPPRRLDDFEDYAAAETRLQELNLQRQELQQRILDLRSKLAAAGVPRRGPSHEAAALTTGGPKTKPDRTSALRSELEDAIRLHPVVDEAVELQRRVVSDLRTRHSKTICEAIAPEHGALLREVAEEAAALSRACQAEHDLRRDLDHQGVVVLSYLRPLSSVGHLGQLDDVQSSVVACLKECVEIGVLELSELGGLGVSPKVLADLRAVNTRRDPNTIY